MNIIKRTLGILGILVTYEVIKYIITELIIRIQANDDIDQPPRDFDKNNHEHLNYI